MSDWRQEKQEQSSPGMGDFSMQSRIRRWLFVGILFAGIVMTGCRIRQMNAEALSEISGNVLRLHVRANSNTSKDQMIKLKVRDALICKMSEFRNEMTDVSLAKQAVRDHMDELCGAAQAAVSDLHENGHVNIEIGKAWFPEKSYGDVILPSGNYEAVIVNIGSGNGKNWWCVLFPQLCFTDPEHGYVSDEGKETLQSELSDETYESLIDHRVEAKLKIVQWIKELRDF